MKRTLIVATTSYAGMGPYVCQIVNAFSKNDAVFYLFRDYEDRYFEKNIKKELHEKSVFLLIPNTRTNKLKDLLPIKKAIYEPVVEQCKNCNIEVVHFINNPGPIKLVRHLERMGIRVVSTVHDLHPHESKKAWYKKLRFHFIYNELYKNLLASQNLITNSDAQYNELLYSYPKKNIFYHSFPSLVTNSITSGTDAPEELACMDKPYILFFGRLEKYKGIDLLYNVFLNTPGLRSAFRLVIAGGGTIPLERRKDEKGVVWINRYIKDSEVENLYKRAYFVVYPYISATQSGVLSLAFFYNVFTVASDVPFFRSIIEPNEAGLLFRAGDERDLREKLLEAATCDRQHFVQKGAECYKRLYDENAIKEALINIYNTVK